MLFRRSAPRIFLSNISPEMQEPSNRGNEIAPSGLVQRGGLHASQMDVGASGEQLTEDLLIVPAACHHQDGEPKSVYCVRVGPGAKQKPGDKLRFAAGLGHVNRPMKRCPTVVVANVNGNPRQQLGADRVGIIAVRRVMQFCHAAIAGPWMDQNGLPR
jgi:hypothetical protein